MRQRISRLLECYDSKDQYIFCQAIPPTKAQIMSAAIPAALKAADVARFAHRAGQLEKARPAVAYWCQLHWQYLVRSSDFER